MAQDSIEKILQSRRQAAATPEPEQTVEGEADKFFSILLGEGLHEHFLELRFAGGMRTAFSYHELMWFNHDPEAGTLDLEFGGYWVTLTGRGLGDRLFDGIKQKRVAWVKEADVDMQDHEGNSVFIKEILITPPGSGETEEKEEG